MHAIRVKDLSKLYYLGETAPYSFRELLSGLVSLKKTSDQSARELWSLRDLSFDVNEGEAVGIVGHNGAGKSTLLKILSRITKPTSGTAEIHGRVGSLLEVGTGFHSELSGAENIYLNGAILGMRRVEIKKRFDEIVAFSEMEKFLDTPVKHYSTGMYMRLAFSIAAHLEPDVLIVDEVLAVGDVGFQKKCLRKMREVGESGRTVFFVSHDMQAVTRLCSRVLWLQSGELRGDGEAKSVVSSYLHERSETGAEKYWNDEEQRPGNEHAQLLSLRIRDEDGKTMSTADIGNRVGIEMAYRVSSSGKNIVAGFQFYNEQGFCVFVSHDWSSGWREQRRENGEYVSTVWIPGNFLSEGSVFVTALAATYEPFEQHFIARDAATFNVVDNANRDNMRGDLTGPIPGAVRPKLDWETTMR
jgi:lipopolysaccharide transport system ATP-binding protein